MDWWVVDMLSISEIDASANDGVGVDNMEGILPAHRVVGDAWDYLPWHIQIRRL